ncbi:hypothetical protein [Microbacterium sp. CIAB417]|uniref:hypothetical protein n=1 Tax=Microbacterium sp. CIAB417 TaxID=2860287 RepID=UPI001FAC929B|nr:hypothetical protein [Microbacterium sp. CIAB417]
MSTVAVLVSRSGSAAAIGDLDAEEITVIGPDAAAYPVELRPLPLWIDRLRTLAWRTVLGRNLVRLSPFDDSRRLWNALRRDASIAAVVRDADVVVAGDRDAVFSVWQMSRKSRTFGGGWAAVYGFAAAQWALEVSRTKE